MKITVKLFATLRDFGPKYSEIEIKEGSKLYDVIKHFKIPDDFPLIRLVNGDFANNDYELKDGDIVSLFPPIAGG
ncbi:MAG: MoaD/ThiS family protein [Proteobacteria bacterium]|nr:MoaD/ThiS family protein [Pseudomonadota bacterium]